MRADARCYPSQDLRFVILPVRYSIRLATDDAQERFDHIGGGQRASESAVDAELVEREELTTYLLHRVLCFDTYRR